MARPDFHHFINQCQTAILNRHDLLDQALRDIRSSISVLPALSSGEEAVVRNVLVRLLVGIAARLGPLRTDYELVVAALDLISGESLKNDFDSCLKLWLARAGIQKLRRHDIRVERALVAINQHYANPNLCSLEIARATNISKAHLTRLLRRHTGATFKGNVRVVRIRAAVELLSTTTLSIKEVAIGVGYATVSEFNHDFKRIVGSSPSYCRIQRAIFNNE